MWSSGFHCQYSEPECYSSHVIISLSTYNNITVTHGYGQYNARMSYNRSSSTNHYHSIKLVWQILVVAIKVQYPGIDFVHIRLLVEISYR